MYVVNVKYSENLGDGVIAECIERLAESSRFSPRSFDLSSKKAFGPKVHSGNSKSLLAFLKRYHIAVCILNVVYGVRLMFEFLRLKKSNIVVFGGGQLISGAEFFFPGRMIFIFLVARYIWRSRVVFYGVGVSKSFDFGSQIIYRFMLSRSEIFVRDITSKERVDKIFGCRSEVVADPGICASLIYDNDVANSTAVGLCVTHPKSLAVHDDICGHYDIDFYVSLVNEVVKNGQRVSLYCNGLADDYKFQKKVYDVLDDSVKAEVISCPRPQDTKELVAVITSMSHIFAHRLHSCIIAYSYGINTYGFEWDDKLESFFSSIDLSDNFIAKDTPPSQLAHCLRYKVNRALSNEYVHSAMEAHREKFLSFHSES